MRSFSTNRQKSFFITRPCFAYKAKKPLHTGVRTGCHYLIRLPVCLFLCVFVTFLVFTDCESCMRPISTNPRSMEAGEYGPTRGTCFLARRPEVVAVATHATVEVHHFFFGVPDLRSLIPRPNTDFWGKWKRYTR